MERRARTVLFASICSGTADLNYRNPRVVQEMRDVLIFWLDMGAAGFRVDAVSSKIR